MQLKRKGGCLFVKNIVQLLHLKQGNNQRHFAYPDQWCEYCMGSVAYYGESNHLTLKEELSDYTPEEID